MIQIHQKNVKNRAELEIIYNIAKKESKKIKINDYYIESLIRNSDIYEFSEKFNEKSFKIGKVRVNKVNNLVLNSKKTLKTRKVRVRKQIFDQILRIFNKKVSEKLINKNFQYLDLSKIRSLKS